MRQILRRLLERAESTHGPRDRARRKLAASPTPNGRNQSDDPGWASGSISGAHDRGRVWIKRLCHMVRNCVPRHVPMAQCVNQNRTLRQRNRENSGSDAVSLNRVTERIGPFSHIRMEGQHIGQIHAFPSGGRLTESAERVSYTEISGSTNRFRKGNLSISAVSV